MMRRVMTAEEQMAHIATVNTVAQALALLVAVPDPVPEDVSVAEARLANWITENAGRWTLPDAGQHSEPR